MMEDLFPQDENASPEMESQTEELMEALISIAPHEVVEHAIDNANEHIQNVVGKIGRMCAIRGHSAFRAGVGTAEKEGTSGALICYAMVAVDQNAIVHKGGNVEEVQQAFMSSMDALNQYFDSLSPEA
jgi:hypothetical protein